MKLFKHIIPIVLFLLCLNAHAQNAEEQKAFWKKVRKEMPGFKRVFKKYKKYRFEIVYTRVVNDPLKGRTYQRYYFGDHETYFYPASTVKFPIALKTFQRINHLRHEFDVSDPALCPVDSNWCGQVYQTQRAHRYLQPKDSLSLRHAISMSGLQPFQFCKINNVDLLGKIPPGKTIRLTEKPDQLSIYEMMNDMLIYSNNHFFNWLFEFSVNQNTAVLRPGIDIHKRLMVCNTADSSVTRPLLMLPGYGAPGVYLESERINTRTQPLFSGGYMVGKKHYDFNNQLIKHGRNFSNHNQVKLDALQDQLIELIYPGYLPEGAAYEITDEQRIQLIKWLGMRPAEDKIVSDSSYLKVPEDFTNFLYTGQKHETLPQNLRIANVIGQAYGFVTDCAYICDEDKKVEFFLAARIYVNKDGVLNDDKYEYETIAYPLMEKLGRIIFQHEQADPQGSGALPWVFQIFR